jgi:hypothetical protein
MAYRFDRLPAPSGAARAEFDKQGFLIVERLLHDAQVEALRASFPRIFAGKFDTGVYPDEWYWREGISLPDVTRHMANASLAQPFGWAALRVKVFRVSNTVKLFLGSATSPDNMV